MNTNNSLSINDIFDQIFVISFKDDPHRDFIKKYYKKYNIKFKFVDAIDGFSDTHIVNHYNDYLTWKFNDPRTCHTEKSYKRKLIKSPGALGLLKTYENIFEKSIKLKYKNILIFEDDVFFDNNFNTKVIDFFTHITNYDMVYLGASHHVWNSPSIENLNSVSYYKAPVVLDGSFATAYNYKTYSTLLKEIKNYNAPIDLCLRNINKLNNSYVIYPNICIAETTKVSKISTTSRNLRFHKDKVNWDTKHIDFTRGCLKVSVIIANYNNQKFINYCLNSIKKQTYPNIEIIFIDDCSTDDSLVVVNKWKKKNKKIDLKIISLKNNVGAYKARNIALKSSTGFFITLLDSDDVFLPKKIETDIYNYFNNPDCEVFLSNMYRSQNIKPNTFNNQTKLLETINKEREENKIIDQNYYPWNYQFRLGMPTLFVAKDFFDRYGNWRDDHRFGMDIELIQRYILQKYLIFVDHKKLFVDTHLRKNRKYGIYAAKHMNYVSFPMTSHNATNICKNEERELIHTTVNQELKQILFDVIPEKSDLTTESEMV